MKTAVFGAKSYDIEYFTKENERIRHTLEFFEAGLNSKTAQLASGFDAVCAFVNDKLDRNTLTILSDLNIGLVALRCAGFNNVDLDAAEELGIRVMRVPAYSPHAVAEHALALILTLSRKTHKAYNRVRDANFSLERFVGFDLEKKTAGVIGTGKIGQVFAEIMLGFKCNVVAYDPYPDKSLKQKGVKYLTKNEVFQRSDIVSLHCPLTPETHQIVNKDTLRQMKSGSMLINTSRGKLINTDDVIESLRGKHLGYLGIDVYAEEEKLFFKDLSEHIIDDEKIMHLMTFPNVLITAHQGFLTKEALTEIAATTLRNISSYEKGEIDENEVTRQMMA
ncbi:MAG: 2-hydroxyacid dehydrogenase [Bacteroidales bacterium]|nr:2-hydroxyacid dehydrogenase [Bacteroidales bacterium]